MAKSVREWQEEFIKLFTKCREELGVNDLRIELWYERHDTFNASWWQEVNNHCDITIK